MEPKKESLSDLSARLKSQFAITETSFDAECIYKQGDLSALLTKALADLLPTEAFDISEKHSVEKEAFIATIKHNGNILLDIRADDYADFLPDDFSDLFESIPALSNTGKLFCLVNPKLSGQVFWYYCGTMEILTKCKAEGLPIILPNEDWLNMDLSQFEY